ncbi:hypothetical protein Bbelb_290430 [Branchiostoma belcheri]|nr:hypothetical protein Bbelb_290430 [Branchiostoma belcheri]
MAGNDPPPLHGYIKSVSPIKKGHSYNIIKLQVKTYNGRKYLSTTPETTYEQIPDLPIPDEPTPEVDREQVTGTYPGDKPHGNSNDPDSAYLRCRCETMEKIGAAACDVIPSIAFRRLKDELPLAVQPTNLKQVNNKRYRETKKRRGGMPASGNNVTDHIQQLEAPDGHPFARQVIRGYNKDRHRRTSDFLWTNVRTWGLEDCCSMFFDHIRSRLEDPPSLPVVGDNERALRLAIARAWPGCHQLYCHRHLRKNCADHLQKKIGMSDKARRPFVTAVFGENGLTAARSQVVFDERLRQARNQAAAGNFGTYFEEQAVPFVKSNFDILMVFNFISPVLLGDAAYPHLPWLMKPYPDNGHLSEEKTTFNYRLSQARMTVECAFGRLKGGRWRCLSQQLNIDLDRVPTVVTACCVLHNVCEEHGENQTVNKQIMRVHHDAASHPGITAMKRKVTLSANKTPGHIMYYPPEEDIEANIFTHNDGFRNRSPDTVHFNPLTVE